MLEMEDPYDEAEHFLSSRNDARQPHKCLQQHAKNNNNSSPPLGRNNRTLYIILFASVVSLVGIISLFYSGQKNASPGGESIQKNTTEDDASAVHLVDNIRSNTVAEGIPQQLLDTQQEETDRERDNTVTLPTKSDAIPVSNPVLTKEPAPKTEASHILAEFGSKEYFQQVDDVVERAMSAILEEYGQAPIDNYRGKNMLPNGNSMFAWDKIDLTTSTEAPEAFEKRGNRGNGGWTSSQSWKGFVFRLVQALSEPQSEFTVVLAGHSAAAGHGNHFHQSYLMQFHKVMAPILSQLEVTLISRNQAQGGLGTIQSSLGFNSIYGSDIDIMLWDSGMTENNNPEHIDLFFRQALMVEGRVPVVWGAGGKFDLLKIYHNAAGADIGEYGIGWDGVSETIDENQAETLPWATQHLKCNDERPDLCKHPYKFCATCWIDRPDKIFPEQKQYDKPHGQVRWHPGWRRHQLQGRVLAFAMLQGLRDAIEMLRDEGISGMPNMATYYDNIRTKMKALDPSLGHCNRLNSTIPARICRTPMKGRTQYTPRMNPQQSSVSSLVKAAPPNNYRPRNHLTALYDGPDVPNQCLDLPEGAVDVVARIHQNVSIPQNLRRILEETTSLQTKTSSTVSHPTASSSERATMIVPGRGWQILNEPQGDCDGTYDSVCAKSTRNRCVLYGHHDERGAVLGSEMAGWLVMQIPRNELQAGILMLKLHTWYEAPDNSRTVTWRTVNNVDSPTGEVDDSSQQSNTEADNITRNNVTDPGTKRRNLRKRMYVTPELNPNFKFEYSIDGVVTSWNRTKFLAQKQDLARMVETVTLLDDETFLSTTAYDSRGSLVEFAIRLVGCYHHCVFGVSAVYWA